MKKKADWKSSDTFINIGHRGAMGHSVENSLPSMQKAIQIGVDAVEFDVYAIEGELVVFHDENLKRLTGKDQSIYQTPLAELLSLEIGEQQKIPTLSQILSVLDDRVMINIEIKGKDTARVLVNFLDQQTTFDTKRWLISSFDMDQLAIIRANFADGLIATLFRQWEPNCLSAAQKLGAIAINLPLGEVSKEIVNNCHQHGFKVFVFAVNERQDIEKAKRLKVDGVFSNYPDRVNEVRDG